jgi:hypothetical protein
MKGASMKRETNTKFIVRLMDYSSTGPLMQAFVLEALHDYSAKILATDTPTDPDASFISWAAWYACADEVQQAMANRRH